MPDNTFVTDDQLYDAADRCIHKLIEMCAHAYGDARETPTGSLPRTVFDSLRLDAEDFMFYDPKRIDEEYTRMLAAAKAIGVNPNAYADLEETKNHLINWTGDAATAFKRQVDLMVEYCNRQELNILQGMLHLIAAGQLAIRARADYLNLLEATIAAAKKEIDEYSERASQAWLSIGANIVESALDMDAGKLLTGTLGIFVKVGANAVEREIEGDGADAVVDNYVRTKNDLRESYRRELEDLQRKLMERTNEVVAESQPLKEPLPAYCHVESPDFRYEKFQSTRGGDPGAITPIAEEERKKYVEDKRAHDSEINRRLDGDKGAI